MAGYGPGAITTMSEEAIDNYGEEYRNKRLTVTHAANKYMPAQEFYAKGMPQGYHPGYDEGAGGWLYDFEEIEFSLYEWEVN